MRGKIAAKNAERNYALPNKKQYARRPALTSMASTESKLLSARRSEPGYTVHDGGASRAASLSR
jgi:hypothetical protein